MRTIITTFIFAATITSCSLFSSLTSNTTINPNESFILGDNEHGTFVVQLKNVSNHDLKIIMAPIAGGKHSPIIVSPKETISIKAEKNTALVIENRSDEMASVDLKITGDTGLSMGYKK